MKGNVFGARAWLVVAAVLLLSGRPGPGAAELRPVRKATEMITLDDLPAEAQQWARENLDEDVLAALSSSDREKTRALLDRLEKEFAGEYVLDLAALKDAAKGLVPLLEQYEETAPYAIWLKTRLDYLEVADELKATLPVPKIEPGKAPPLPPAAPPVRTREIFIQKFANRPWPPAAKEYVERLKPIFEVEKVPPELVWIAEVESSFDPRARSPVGAAGLFQLMPATAKRYGLRSWPLDQRLHPGDSAHAAAKYLRYLHGKFHDWRLALAAYNSGEGTVQKLMERYKARSFDEIAAHLPSETQLYVPKIEATLVRREGMKLAELKGSGKS